jgi:beta-N-acetylhexosaminidase
MPNLVGSIPSARDMGATMSVAQITETARALAVRMRAAGVTMDLAPVLDIDGRSGPNNADPDGTRSFSADEKVASADGIAFADGLRAGGVTAVAKHFPGLGGVSGNTDVTPATTPAWKEVQGAGLLPFADAVAAGVPAIMVGNAVVPGLTTLPASISPAAIIGALRSRLGFRGLVLTDSLSGAALKDIGYSVPRAATAALAAGADMFLYDAYPAAKASALAQQTVAAVVSAVRSGAVPRPRLEQAVTRILTAKGLPICRGI